MSERRSGRTDTELANAGLKECPICRSCWSLRGFLRHYNPCKARDTHRQKALETTLDARFDSTLASTSQNRQNYSNNIYSATVSPLLGAETHLGHELANLEPSLIDAESTTELDGENGEHFYNLHAYMRAIFKPKSSQSISYPCRLIG